MCTRGGRNISFLVVSVGQACNFKCKNCGTMAPYSPKEIKRYDCDDIIKSLENILKVVKKIRLLQIQGGEPFLYNDLEKLLRFVTSSGKIDRIEVATNGSVKPGDSLFSLMKEKNVGVRISDYKIVPVEAETLYKKCRDMGIKVKYYTFTSGKSKWYYKGLDEMEKDNNDKKCRDRFAACRNNGCLTLERSRLYYCSRAVNAGIIQHFTEKATDYCLVDGDPDFAKRLANYIVKKHFMEACRYCHGTDDTYLCEPAEQMKGIERHRKE